MKRLMKQWMKRSWLFALAALLALTGCGGQDGEAHPDWDESWVRMADYVAIETPEGFALNESNDVLSISGLYYATWTTGEGRTLVNADGEEAMVYDAQIYVLLEECRDGEAAAAAVGSWIAREQQAYEAGETETASFAGQEFTLLPLISGGEDNPYGHGTAAFAVRDQWAVSVELVCSDRFTGDSQQALTGFLEGFHYSGT